MDNNNFESVRDHCDLLMAIKPSFIAENVDARDISRLAIALYKTNWYHYWNLEGTMVTRLDGTLFWEDVPRRNQRSPTPSTLVMGSAHDRRQRLSQEDLRKLRDRNMDKARLLIRLELLRLMFLKKVVHLKFKNKRYERLSSRNALRRVLMADGKPATWPSGDPIFPESPRKKKKTTLKKRGLVEKITSFFGRANGEGRGEGRGEGSRSESSSVSSESSTKSYDPREMLSSDSLSSRSSSSDVSHELSLGSSLLNKPFSTRGPLHREVHAYRGLRLPSPEVAHLLLTPYRNNIKASDEFQPPPPWQQSCQGPDRPSGPELPRTAFSRMTGMVASTAYSDDEDEIESE